MEAKAKARYLRVTPRKARRVIDLIRGQQATEALAVLKFAEQSASDPIDRKSTRLNSSHVAISYAVFCLKKKIQVHLRISKHIVMHDLLVVIDLEQERH